MHFSTLVSPYRLLCDATNETSVLDMLCRDNRKGLCNHCKHKIQFMRTRGVLRRKQSLEILLTVSIFCMIISGVHRGHRPSLPPLWAAIFRVSSLILQGSVPSSCILSWPRVYMVRVATLSHWCENKPARTSTIKGSVAPTHHSRESSCRELSPPSSKIQSYL
jgi:hypothetical protein